MDYPGEKLLIALWQTLAEKGVGGLLSPWQQKRLRRADLELRAEELRVIAQAQRDAADISSGRKRLGFDGLLRLGAGAAAPQPAECPAEAISRVINPTQLAVSGVIADRLRQEVNVAHAILATHDELADDPQEPSSAKLGDEWLYRWRDGVGEVSSEDLRKLWARALAGELKSPGMYSLRTLEFLRNLSREEARSIELVSQFAVEDMIIRERTDEILATHGAHWTLLNSMQQLGLLAGTEAVSLNAKLGSTEKLLYFRPLRCHNRVLLVTDTDATRTLSLNVYSVTTLGAQVLSLGHFKANEQYLRLAGEAIRAHGFQVKLADWTQLSKTTGQYDNAIDL